MSNSKTLIVTGAAGFIGSTFVRQALDKGYKVVVLDALTYAGHRENLESIEDRITLVVDSICNTEAVERLFEEHQPRALINFAAESHVDNSINGPEIFIDTNIKGTFTLLEAARAYYKKLDSDDKKTFRFVQISTDEVFGSLGEEGHFTEFSRIKPNSPYSATKAGADHLVRAWYKTYGLPTITTHCSNNYGPRQNPEKLIPHMITRALNWQSLPVYGDGKNIRDWIHVEDHCRGIMLAMERGNVGETYAFGGRAELENLTLVETLCSYLDEVRPHESGQSYASLTAFVPDRPGHDRRYAIDDSKAESQLGFTRQYAFETGIRQTIDWYLDNDEWCQATSNNTKAA